MNVRKQGSQTLAVRKPLFDCFNFEQKTPALEVAPLAAFSFDTIGASTVGATIGRPPSYKHRRGDSRIARPDTDETP